MRNVLRKSPVRTDIAMIKKMEGGGTKRIAIEKMFYEYKKELTESNGVEKLSPVNIL